MILDMTLEHRLLMNPRTERNIIKRISRGDLKAFEMLFREYYEPLCRHALKLLNDADEAEEVVQDLFYALWEKRLQLRIETSVNAYLYSAVHNRCMKVLRHKTVESKFKEQYNFIGYLDDVYEVAYVEEHYGLKKLGTSKTHGLKLISTSRIVDENCFSWACVPVFETEIV